jgi:hypothetical protein
VRTHFVSLLTSPLVAATVLALAGPVTPAHASNDALLRLLRVLRDRGTISMAEYEELREAAEEVPRADVPASPIRGVPALWVTEARPPVAQTRPPSSGLSPQAVDARLAEQDAALQGVKKELDEQRRTLADKWYERLGLRGYTQFRFAEASDGDSGAALEVPADRSVNEDETLIIRRGRFVLSGDVSSHLALYAQLDFNGSPGGGDFALQMRDLYADIFLNEGKTFRVRLGQSKVPYGFSNVQSSQNRAALERPEGINSAAEGERDYGAYLMWASREARQRFRDLVARGLKGSGDYGVVAAGVYGGQGLNRPDQNGEVHVLARVSYPFELAGGQFVELGANAYSGRYVTTVQPIPVPGMPVTPVQEDEGTTDQRVGVTAVWYPQPIGIEAEWNVGNGPELSDDLAAIESRPLNGGYVQVSYRRQGSAGTWFPFARWNYFDGGRKFARNAPRLKVNDLDLGVEFARWQEVEFTVMYSHTFERTRTSAFPYAVTRGADRVGFQVQWNY